MCLHTQNLAKKTLPLALAISINLMQNVYSVPNAGSLLNIEEEIKKVNILPTQVPEDKELINGVSVSNGEKIEVKGFKFDGQTNGFTNEQLTEVIKDLIGEKFYRLPIYKMPLKEFKTFTEIKVIFLLKHLYQNKK